ncbi:MAG: tape measure protein, partial [Oscillospiraceae bacterium]|nr:tape measure protein [Oscillospiraceae bacterium]
MNSKVAAGAKKASESLKSGLKVSAGAISAVAGGVGAFVVKGMKYGAMIEQLQTSFEVMLGSADKAKKMIADMTAFAAKTPFQTTDLAQAGKTLMGYGVQAKDVMGTLKMLGDVSQGNAEKMKGLALVYGQIMANGKLQGQDLLQLISNGFNPLKIISKKTGKSMAELLKEMSKGKISAQEVADAFKTATSKGGQFYNDMEKQSKTFNGQVSTLKDSVNMFSNDFTKNLQSIAKNDALPKINSYMESLNKALKSGGLEGVNKEIGSIAADAINQIAKAAPDVVKEATNLITAFNNGNTDNAGEISKSAVKIGEELVKGLEQIIPSAGLAVGALIKGIVTQIAGSDAGNAVQSTIDSIGKAFESLKGPAESAVKSISEIIGNLATTVSQVAQTVLPTLSSALGFVAEHFQQIIPAVLGTVAAFKTFTTVKTAAQSVVKFTDSMLKGVEAGGKAEKALKGIS